MNGTKNGGLRLVFALALVATVAIGATGLARAQVQEERPASAHEQVERELRHALAMQEARLAEIQARQEKQLYEARARLEAALAHREEGVAEAMARARAAQERARVRLREVAPQLRSLAPMVAHGFMSRMGGGVERILMNAEELDLTDAQVEQIRAARSAHRRAEIAREADIEVAELDLRDLMHDSDDADLGAVETKMMEIARLRVEDRVAGMRLDREVRALLTADQREQLDEMGPRGFMFRRGDDGEGRMFFRRDGDEDGYSFHIDPETWQFRGGDWLDEGFLFEALEPLHNFEFRLRHDDEAHEHEDGGDEGASGAASTRPGAGGAEVIG